MFPFMCVFFRFLISHVVFSVQIFHILKFIPKYFISFDAIVNEFVLFIFWVFCCQCIEMQLIFIFWSCTLQFYRLSLICSKSFLVEFWSFLCVRLYLQAVTFYFFISNLETFCSFFFFAWLLYIGLRVLCWISMVRMGTKYLFLIFEWVFNHWLLSMMLTMTFITLDYVLSMPNLGVSIMKGYCILSDAFSTSIDRIIWFLAFILLMWYITIIDLHDLNHPCIPGINLTWPWCMFF